MLNFLVWVPKSVEVIASTCNYTCLIHSLLRIDTHRDRAAYSNKALGQHPYAGGLSLVLFIVLSE